MRILGLIIFIFFCSLTYGLVTHYFFSSGGGAIVSDFSMNADGWTAPNAAGGILNYVATGGNPTGYVSATGYNSGVMFPVPIYFYFTAPAKFLGNVSSLYNHTITFDLQEGTNQTLVSLADVILSNGTTTLYYFSLPSQPAVAPGWSSYSVTVNELSGNWKTSNSITGTAATKDQIKTVLLNLTSFQIRGRYGAAITTGSLDNVVMNTQPVPTAPVITSFTPTSGLPGTTVTINGSNFNPSATQNTIYFNGIKGKVVTASATQLTVTTPAKAAYGLITVTNLANGTQGTSSLNFNPLFNNNNDFGARVIPSTFAKKVDFGSSPTEVGMSVGDLDGDGLTDVLTSGNSLKASVFRNTGQTGSVSATSFAAPLVLTMPTGLLSGNPGPAGRVGQNAIADMDGDGKLDLIINVGYNQAGNYDNSFAIFLNQSTPGNLSFSSGSVFQYATAQNNNEGIAIADIDGDGRPELIGALGNSACQIGIAQNLSTPGNLDFAQIQNFGLGVTFGANISLGDLNGDNKPEIIIEAYLGGAINIYENISTVGTVALNTPFQISTINTININVADLDNDGKNDLIFKDGNNPSNVHLKKNNHTSGALTAADFSADILLPSLYPTGGTSYQTVTTADVNGDNKIDIIANDASKVIVYQNNYSSGAISAASFVAGIAFEGDTNPNDQYVLCADVDGDNKPEILVLPPSSNVNFRVYHNETFPAPTINLFTPTSGPWTTSVSLTGNSFSTGIGSPPNIGRLGLTGTVILPASNTAASTTVPSGAISDRFSITEHGLTGFSKFFNVTFPTNRTINSSSFLPGVDFTLSNTGGIGLTVADYDNDGKPDIIADDNFTGRIFQNTLAVAGSTITTSTYTKLAATLTTTWRLTSGDFDGDGKVDVVTGNNLFQNNSTTLPSFAAGVTTNIPTNSVIVPNHDFNLDGKPDLVSLNVSQFYVCENLTRNGAFTPSGTFASFSGSGVPFATFLLSGNANGLTANDFDGDGYDDIALGLVSTTSTLSVYLNNGLNLPITTAQFAAPVNFTANGSPTQIVAADFDGDGKTDVALGYNVATLSIFKNQSTPGSLSFAAKQDMAAVAGITAIAAQDLDGDALPEIITTNFIAGVGASFSVYKNTSSGSISFAPAVTFALAPGRNPTNLFIADVNLDHLPDIIIRGNAATNFLTVFQNNILVPVITVTTQPVGGLVICSGTTTQFTVAAAGTSNIAYQWQYSADGIAPYADITNSGGYTNVATAALTVNTTGNFGAGFYRCRITGDFAAQVYSNPASVSLKSCSAPIITAQPLATQIGGTITLNLVPLISTPGSTLNLSSLQIATPPSSGALASISASGVLTINYAAISFTGTENISIRACDLNGICATQPFSIEVAGDVVVFNGVSPNGNNPTLYLQYIEIIPDTKVNTVQIFDRWENLVWHGSNYDNTNVVFKGVSDNGNDLPTGVYFYKIDFASGKKSKTGFISLKR
ncbi:MAG: VCBS repeat-containing protein [Bacteroidetes bacterium]|nr:VCBS repeat-containing protein [Bacteroidota bacterium]